MAQFVLAITLLLLVYTLAVMQGATATALDIPKIDPVLVQQVANDPSARFNIFITMRDGTTSVLARFPSTKSKNFAQFESEAAAEERTALRDALQRHAEESQAALLQELDEAAAAARAGFSADDDSPQMQVTSFWITNQIYVQWADESVLDMLRDREDVLRVDQEAVVMLDETAGSGDVTAEDLSPVPFDLSYNMELIRVPDVWANDVNGSGVVVGHIDTGVLHTHEALRASYKDDAFSWFDAVTGSVTPIDGQGQGTMTMGLLAGGLEIGVAFGAEWIACRAMNNNGVGDQSDFLECGQFILCPTTPDGKESDCSQAPRVVSNGWNSVDPYATWFLTVINAWTAAGIIPVWSAGNYGDRPDACVTLGSHAPYAQVIAVGATTEEDRLWARSSQGPSVLDEVEGIKPEVTAPGADIRSASNQGETDYDMRSGTGMAQAHVAGVIALLLSMDPDLGFDEVKRVLETTAAHDLGFAGAECRGRPDSEFPNYQFGHGRLDAYAAYECVKNDYNCLEEPPTTTTTSTTTTSPPPTTTTTEPTTTTSTTTTTEPPTTTTTTTTSTPSTSTTTPTTTTTEATTTTTTPTAPTPTSPTPTPSTSTTTASTTTTTSTTLPPEPSTSEEPSTSPSGAGLGKASHVNVYYFILGGIIATVKFQI